MVLAAAGRGVEGVQYSTPSAAADHACKMRLHEVGNKAGPRRPKHCCSKRHTICITAHSPAGDALDHQAGIRLPAAALAKPHLQKPEGGGMRRARAACCRHALQHAQCTQAALPMLPFDCSLSASSHLTSTHCPTGACPSGLCRLAGLCPSSSVSSSPAPSSYLIGALARSRFLEGTSGEGCCPAAAAAAADMAGGSRRSASWVSLPCSAYRCSCMRSSSHVAQRCSWASSADSRSSLRRGRGVAEVTAARMRAAVDADQRIPPKGRHSKLPCRARDRGQCGALRRQTNKDRTSTHMGSRAL